MNIIEAAKTGKRIRPLPKNTGSERWTKPKIEMIGKTFGRLRVLRQAPDNPGQYGAVWFCACECGVEKTFRGGQLRGGTALSCGCHREDSLVSTNYRHGMTDVAEHKVWRGIKKRCLNPNEPNYRYYGGRGIAICDEWKHDFMAFYNHIGPRPSSKHTIDRIDNERGYEPGNVRWATVKEQSNNRRQRRPRQADPLAMELGFGGDE